MASRARRSADHLFKLIIEQVSDIVVITSAEDGPDGHIDPRIEFVNPAFTRVTGYTSEEAVGRRPGFLRGPDTDRLMCARIRRALEARQPVRGQLLNYAKDGRPYWLDLNIIPLTDEAGVVTHFAAIERDITAQKRTEIALGDLAATDGLTGLLNRRALDRALRREIARARRYRKPLSLIAVDLDHFKRVNDTYGHDAGDAVLVGFSAVARRSLRETDLIGRVGGEEFEIVAADTDLHGAALLAGRFADELRHSLFHCRGVDIGITASFGVTAFNGPADSAEEMRRRADEALYQAKRAGRDRIESTDPRRCHTPAA